MNKFLQPINLYIRNIKNQLVKQYFHTRIYGRKAPYQILLRNQDYKILFILSHMRSGSSLLSHILISNPEIIGFGESHLKYQSELDFKKLMMRVYFQHQEFSKIPDHLYKFNMNHQYILDKVLHDQKFLTNDFLNSPQVYVIFLLRQPQQTIPSLLDLKPHWNQKDAYEYYRQRLLTLEKYAQIIVNAERTLLLTYNQILDQTFSVLKTLQQFLKTETEFSEKYQILKTTGQKNIGDYKGNIKAGKIVRTQRNINIQIDEEIIKKAEYSYQESTKTLSKYCQIITSN
jgi:hypothetical protein